MSTTPCSYSNTYGGANSPILKEYPIFNPDIELLRNAVVFQNGACTQKSVILKKSTYQYRDCIEECYLYVLTAANWNTVVGQSDTLYLIVHGPYTGLYHWLTDSIPRLWLARSRLNECELLLPEHLASDLIVKESVGLFNVERVTFLPASTSMYVQNLLLPELKPYFVIFNARIVKSIRSFFLSTMNEAFNRKTSRRIYIRPFNPTCAISNETEIEMLMRQNSFEILSLTCFSLVEWIKAMTETEFLVSSSDDQLALMHFLPPGASVFELGYEPGNDVNLYFDRYRNLAGCLEVKFSNLLASHIGYEQVGRYTKVFEFNIDLLHQRLIEVLAA